MFSNLWNGLTSMISNINNNGLLKTGIDTMFPEIGAGMSMLGNFLGGANKVKKSFQNNDRFGVLNGLNNLIQAAPISNQFKQFAGGINNVAQQYSNYGQPQNNGMGAFGQGNPLGLPASRNPQINQGYDAPNYYPQSNGNLGRRQLPYDYMDEDADYGGMPQKRMPMMGPSGGGVDSMGSIPMMAQQQQAAPPYAFMRPPVNYQNQPQMIGGGPGSTLGMGANMGGYRFM